jgi:hypothetical protein
MKEEVKQTKRYCYCYCYCLLQGCCCVHIAHSSRIVGRDYSRKRKADFGDPTKYDRRVNNNHQFAPCSVDTNLGPWAPHKKHELMLERLKKEAAERPVPS